MKAITVEPGKRNSVSIQEIPTPKINENEVLIQTLLVGIDGTDREINEGQYGSAPTGQDFLILGHEAIGKIVQVGSQVTDFQIGDLIVPTVRRPDNCRYCQQGFYDLCIHGNYTERGIKGQHGFMSEYFTADPQYLIKIPSHLQKIAVLLEPLSVVEKGIRESWAMQSARMPWNARTGIVLGIGMIGILAAIVLQLKGVDVWLYSRENESNSRVVQLKQAGFNYISATRTPIHEIPQKVVKNIDFILDATGNSVVALSAISILGTNGILCWTGVTGGTRTMEVCSDCINLEMVLGNKAIIGTVNAHRQDFLQGLAHLDQITLKNPMLIPQLMPDIIPLSNSNHILQDIRSPHLLKSIIQFSAMGAVENHENT